MAIEIAILTMNAKVLDSLWTPGDIIKTEKSIIKVPDDFEDAIVKFKITKNFPP